MRRLPTFVTPKHFSISAWHGSAAARVWSRGGTIARAIDRHFGVSALVNRLPLPGREMPCALRQ